MRVMLVGVAVIALSVATPVAEPRPQAAAQAAPVSPRRPGGCPALSDEQIEQFLREAKIVRTKSVGKGVTGSIRATLSDGTLTHDAQIQTIDEKKTTVRRAWRHRVQFPGQLEVQRRRVPARPPDRLEHGAGQRRADVAVEAAPRSPGGSTTC